MKIAASPASGNLSGVLPEAEKTRGLLQGLRRFAIGQLDQFFADVFQSAQADLRRVSRPSFGQLTLRRMRAYVDGETEAPYPEFAPAGRAYFLERVTDLVGARRARELELTAVIEGVHRDRPVDELMKKVDATSQLPVIREMLGQIDRLEIDVSASWRWFRDNQYAGNFPTDTNFRRSLKTLRRQVAELRALIQRTLRSKEMDYARLAQIYLGYVLFVESVNHGGQVQGSFIEHEVADYFVDPDRAISSGGLAEIHRKMGFLREKFPEVSIRPTFTRIHQVNLQEEYRSWSIGDQSLGVTKVKDPGVDYDERKQRAEQSNSKFSLHDLDHLHDSCAAFRHLRDEGVEGFRSDPERQGVVFWFMPPALRALLEQTGDGREQVFFLRGWLAEKQRELERFVESRQGKLKKLAITLGFHFTRETGILDKNFLARHYAVNLYLRRLSERGLAWQDVSAVEPGLGLGQWPNYTVDLHGLLQDQSANLGENLLPHHPSEFSNEDLIEIWNGVAAVFGLPVGEALWRIPV